MPQNTHCFSFCFVGIARFSNSSDLKYMMTEISLLNASVGPGLDRRPQSGVGQVLLALAGQKWIIGVVTAIFTLGAVALSLLVDDRFQASVLVSPVTDDSGGGRLGGLASLATQLTGMDSIGLGSPGNIQKQEFLATLQSEALTERYIRENDLLPVLYASDWDASKRNWKDDVKARNRPTLWKANQFFKRHVRSVISDSKTGLTTITINWKNPQVAAQWANGLVKLTNDYLRGRAIADSERNIAYLKEQLAKTSIIGVQTAINSLLESEMKKAMLAQGSTEYALKVIDPAVPPEKRSSPLPALWIPMGFLLGFLGSSVTVLWLRFRPMRLYLSEDFPSERVKIS